MCPRLSKLPNKSFFIFGPRGVGKSTWLLEQSLTDASLKIDLLQASQFLDYKQNPSLIRNQVMALKRGSWIIIDEIQKLPVLLDEIHSLIFKFKGNYKFALSGSSTRKLKRDNANLLAGRAINLQMFPLSFLEVPNLSIDSVLQYGLLPASLNEKLKQDKVAFLDAYVKNYLEAEIQQEALVRNLSGFYRFFEIVAQMNGQILNISNIAREAGIARSTVQGYFEILSDTYIGFYLPALRLRAKIKEVKHPKFYLFDCGVIRTLIRQNIQPPTNAEKGNLFETYVINEIRSLNFYLNIKGELFYWRTEYGIEVDLIWCIGKKKIGIEIKYTKVWKEKYNNPLNTLIEEKVISKGYGVYTGKVKLKYANIEVLPLDMFLKSIQDKTIHYKCHKP